jgi:hypothetical protein
VDAGLAPFTTEENRGDESRAPTPDFATNRGLDADNVAEPGGGVLELGFSVVLLATVGAAALDARNVLLTETALKVAGFFADEAVRTWPLSLPSFTFDPSALEASVSEPPLTLASVELGCSSRLVIRLFSMSWIAVPFTGRM